MAALHQMHVVHFEFQNKMGPAFAGVKNEKCFYSMYCTVTLLIAAGYHVNKYFLKSECSEPSKILVNA